MIEIGQDAMGGWAWIVLDGRGRMVASGDRLPDRFLAIEIATSVYRGMVTRGEAGLSRNIRISFPDDADLAPHVERRAA